jgi:hypothetical protein
MPPMIAPSVPHKTQTARTRLGAVTPGANGDIASLTRLTTTLSLA